MLLVVCVSLCSRTLFVDEATAGGHARESNGVGAAGSCWRGAPGRRWGGCPRGRGHGPGPPQRSGWDPGLHPPSTEATRLSQLRPYSGSVSMRNTKESFLHPPAQLER